MRLKNKRAVVIPSTGIGDALMMMIASEHLRKAGFEVTTIYPRLRELQDWFPGHTFQERDHFSPDEWIIAQNNNLPHITLLKQSYRDHLSIFYPTYSYNKHGFITVLDRVFDETKPMTENIARAIHSLTSTPFHQNLDIGLRQSPGIEIVEDGGSITTIKPPSSITQSRELSRNSIVKVSMKWCTSTPFHRNLDNGITPPTNLSHRLYPKRVLIHHTSSAPEKNWLKSKYDVVLRGLKKRGFEPVFVPKFATLSELAAFVYESGFLIGNDSLVGHLASNLSIPTLIVADHDKRMRLWRPGWYPGSIVTVRQWIPQWKFLRKNWQHLISPSHVLSVFDQIKIN
jgi:hypothetical protein